MLSIKMSPHLVQSGVVLSLRLFGVLCSGENTLDGLRPSILAIAAPYSLVSADILNVRSQSTSMDSMGMRLRKSGYWKFP